MEVKLNIDAQFVPNFLEVIRQLSYVKMEEVKVQTPYKESIAEGFRRAAQDPEMHSMVEEGIEDYAKLIQE
jgi:hypothetical protein